MRISDWSSDVCSSDLLASGSAVAHVEFIDHEVVDLGDRGEQTFPVRPQEREGANEHLGIPRRGNEIGRLFVDRKGLHLRLPLRIEKGKAKNGVGGEFRSEEHTSELQSLMRNSYAVFCLKKKKRTK